MPVSTKKLNENLKTASKVLKQFGYTCEKNKTPIQQLINGKPSEFARRIGCPKSTANHYSDGTRTPPEWVLNLVSYALKSNYNNKKYYECHYEIKQAKKSGEK